MNDAKWKLILIFLLTAAAAFVAYPADDKPVIGDMFKMTKGLDIQGGTQLIIALQEDQLPVGKPITEAIAETAEKLSTRINIYGMKEPRIETSANTILIAIPGADNDTEVAKVIELLKKTGKLEFKLEATDSVKEAYKTLTDDEIYTRSNGEYRKYTHKPTSTEIARGETTPYSVIVKDKDRLTDQLTGDKIKAARRDTDERGGPAVGFEFNDDGTLLFSKITGENKKKRLAIILDDNLVSAPVIQDQIDRNGIISGNFSSEECIELINVLRSGSLPAPIEIASTYKVGPTLGAVSVKYSYYACLISLAAVMLFMLVYYHLLGLVANIALFINLVLIVALVALFNATLTLPGIAGMVLTMGMAVDANIIFFERMREERALGKPVAQAFDAGFNRAYSAVFDSNITTLIAGVVLYLFGTESIKGFAVTLSIGTVTTLFTAVFCSKAMIQFMIKEGVMKELTMLKLLTKPNFDFMKLGKPAIVASLVCIVAGMAVFFYRGDKNYSIDFTGGTVIEVAFKESQEIDFVRTAVTGFSTEGGKATYPDSEIQSTWTKDEVVSGSSSKFKNFIVRVPQPDQEIVRTDMQKIFGDKLYPAPIVTSRIDGTNTPYDKGTQYQVSLMNPLAESDGKQIIGDGLKSTIETVFIKGTGIATEVVKKDADGKEIKENAYSSFLIYAKPVNNPDMAKVEGSLKKILTGSISPDPFPNYTSIGSRIVKNFKKNSMIALILSWMAIILYLGVRFQFKYGFAAVVALIHDVLFTLGILVAANWLLPDTFGTNLQIGLVSIAAFLTIIGYSVNDTIVTFDRLRENLKLHKREDFYRIANMSINQTLGRTILTALTVFMTVVILFGMTLHTGGGIPGFAFPMIVGTIVGAYSSIYIAVYILLRWEGKSKIS